MSALLALEGELRARPRAWLVTGAAGFIGAHMVARLLALGQRVRGLDDFSTGSRKRLAAFEGAFEFLEGDVADPRIAMAACAGCELVLHQAGLGSVPRSLAEPARSVRVNTEGTWVLATAAATQGVARLVLASSSSVYGDLLDSPQREERVGRPLSPYAASKLAAELVCAGLARSTGPAVVALRYFNVFGPHQDAASPYAAVVARWARALVAGTRPRLEGDGLQARDFTPVSAVVGANLLAATRTLAEPFSVFNVGTGRATSLQALHALLGELGLELGLPRGEGEFERVPARPGDRRSSCADLARARKVLGYEPPATLREALRELLEHARARR